MNTDTSPVILRAIEIMKELNKDMGVEVLSEMKRTSPSEFYPHGQLGVDVKFTILGIEKRVFLGYQMCEDIVYNPHGHLMIDEFIMEMYKDDLKELLIKLNKNEQ